MLQDDVTDHAYLQQTGQENTQNAEFTLLLETKSKHRADGYCENVEVGDSAEYPLCGRNVDAPPPAPIVACSLLPFHRVEAGKFLVHWDALDQEKDKTHDIEDDDHNDARPRHESCRVIWSKHPEVKREERAFGEHGTDGIHAHCHERVL